jgi:hypothetical protein
MPSRSLTSGFPRSGRSKVPLFGWTDTGHQPGFVASESNTDVSPITLGSWALVFAGDSGVRVTVTVTGA